MKKALLILILIFLALTGVFSVGAETMHKGIDLDKSVAKSYTQNGLTMQYRVFLPDDFDADLKYPMVLFLHGSGNYGDDNLNQVQFELLSTLTSDEYQKKFPCVVVAPQAPTNGKKWVNNKGYTTNVDTSNLAVTKSLKMVMKIVDKVSVEYSCDTDRLYVTGLSMGGFGTWDILWRYPGKFAAAVPVCGGGDPNRAKEMGNTPIWIFHGSKDQNVYVKCSRDMYKALKAAGNTNCKYTEYEGVDHRDCWKKAYTSEATYLWMFSQSLRGAVDPTALPTTTTIATTTTTAAATQNNYADFDSRTEDSSAAPAPMESTSANYSVFVTVMGVFLLSSVVVIFFAALIFFRSGKKRSR
ncbi:MAG: dienelactone hydrolase family protein [Oscillospiraceae bacterium]|jgi:predicted peptidase|nr:dienelactone hydrolase family protein [Oscillospiraceae bacterium]